MVRGRKFNRLKNWVSFPKRRARNAMHDCKLCKASIFPQQDYYDAGNNVRVCVPCAEITSEQWREQNGQ